MRRTTFVLLMLSVLSILTPRTLTHDKDIEKFHNLIDKDKPLKSITAFAESPSINKDVKAMIEYEILKLRGDYYDIYMLGKNLSVLDIYDLLKEEYNIILLNLFKKTEVDYSINMSEKGKDIIDYNIREVYSKDFYDIIQKHRNRVLKKDELISYLRNTEKYYMNKVLLYILTQYAGKNEYAQIIKSLIKIHCLNQSKYKYFKSRIKEIKQYSQKTIGRNKYKNILLSDELFLYKIVDLSTELLTKISKPNKCLYECIIIRKIRNRIFEEKYNEAMKMISENKDRYPDNKTFEYYENLIKQRNEKEKGK